MLEGYALCNFLWNIAVYVLLFCFCRVSVFFLQVGFAFAMRCSVCHSLSSCLSCLQATWQAAHAHTRAGGAQKPALSSSNATCFKELIENTGFQIKSTMLD